jgi:hypothetical protein
MYGNRVPPTESSPYRSVIGAVEESTLGFIVLRVGREAGATRRYWEQTEQVVLTPSEVADLMRELARYMPRNSAPGIQFWFDRELARELLDRLDGAGSENESYVKFRALLTDLVASEGQT